MVRKEEKYFEEVNKNTSYTKESNDADKFGRDGHYKKTKPYIEELDDTTESVDVDDGTDNNSESDYSDNRDKQDEETDVDLTAMEAYNKNERKKK